MVRTEDACEIIQFALQKEIRVYLDGGWGVDALIGKETRVHNDIDLFVEVKSYHDYIQIIRQHGFEEVIMEYTTNNHTVWKDDKQRIIDLHCFEFSNDGILYDGDTFPSGTFSGKGKIGDITVSCIEPLSQVMFHLGYEHDENDVHDVLLLCEEFEIEIPDEYIETQNLNLVEDNMASSKEYLDFILEQLSELEEITYRAMMGEYIIYYRGRLLLVDDVDNKNFLTQLINAMYDELPRPKKKKV